MTYGLLMSGAGESASDADRGAKPESASDADKGSGSPVTINIYNSEGGKNAKDAKEDDAKEDDAKEDDAKEDKRGEDKRGEVAGKDKGTGKGTGKDDVK